MSRVMRCAIYTRKSSEEGLDQAFNSLDAQREACAAYIESQRHEGWTLVRTRYDDGGYSGGNLERPALTQLMADLDAGRVDLIVVYKVDRLTRSLSDFAKLVERLDAKGASFVSVTQSFNTTTSMGRLTLNVLLSFAQFEREVTGERIRDKIAASKKKGMWMGGYVPIGYDCVDRRLVINDDEAASVRRIFELYKELGNVEKLKVALKREGIMSKTRVRRNGDIKGGCAFSNGALFAILGNRMYRGEITHKGQIHAGQHDAIIEEPLWGAVQATRERTRQRATGADRAKATSPLRGLIVDELGRHFEPVHTTKGGKRYRYYVSKKEDDAGTDRKQGRIPAERLEQLVSERLRTYLGSRDELLRTLFDQSLDVESTEAIARATHTVRTKENEWAQWRSMLHQIKLRDMTMELVLWRNAVREIIGVARAEGESTLLTLSMTVRIQRTSHDIHLLSNNERVSSEDDKSKSAVLLLLSRARRWYEQLVSGEKRSLREIAQDERLDERYVARVLYSGLLAPEILQRATEGTRIARMTTKSLKRLPPFDWCEQKAAVD